ncbi:MAG: long-chain-fatty-acid--CoA ligase [Candidatus Hodarchaeales archaeon]|jgi:long-chain acyl-CoA synthetase
METLKEYKKPWYKHWPEEIPKNIDYNEDFPIYKFLEQSAKDFPDNTATIFFDNKIRYADLWDRVLKFANGLSNLGIQKGDRVGIYLPNCPQFVISFFAINRLGAIIVPFNTQYVDHELVYQINDSGAEIVICLDIVYKRVRKIRDKGEVKLKHVIMTSLHDELSRSKRILGVATRKVPLKRRLKPPDIGFNELIDKSKPEVPEVSINTKEDLALIQYTGGTTGVSKGAMLTHYNIVSNQIQLTNIIHPPIDIGNECYVVVLPLFHIYALNVCMISAVSQASKMILIPDPRAGRPIMQDLLETLSKYKPTFFHAVPALYLGLLYHKDIKDYDLTSIRACISGAAPLPVEVAYNFEELTGANVVEGYGLTETSPVTHVNPLVGEIGKIPGSIGLPMPDTDVKIYDPNDGNKELPLGEEGEIGVKGPQVMKGYWQKPEETAGVFNEEGYFLTGDIGKIDNYGYFWITDRKKNMIDVSGLKVYPRDVEEILFEHPAVAEVAIVGVPHEFKGETVKAFVVLKDDETASSEEIIDFCKGRMARYKVPRLVSFIDELPRSAIGKVLHRELREGEWTKAGKKKTIDS